MEYTPHNKKHLQTATQAFARQQLSQPYTGNIHCFESIDSTNKWLLEHGNVGDFCLSESQTAGRGRRDNAWISPPSGNIYLSYCCYLDKNIKHRSLLGLVVGIAIAEAIEAIGLSGHGIKWPNDIFWRGKKLGGILIQAAESYDKFIIGVGLNVQLPAQSLQAINQAAVSLEQALHGAPIDREQLVKQLMQHLLVHCELFPQLSFATFLQSWQRWDILKQQSVQFSHQQQMLTGIVNGVDEYGRIGVMIDSEVAYFSAADIKLKKPTEE